MHVFLVLYNEGRVGGFYTFTCIFILKIFLNTRPNEKQRYLVNMLVD